MAENGANTLDMVKLYQYPHASGIVTISPYCLKLETWLRLYKIRYENVFTADKKSSKGLLPFVVINGEEVADSNLIIVQFKERFAIEEELSDEQRGYARAIEMMLDNNTAWSYVYYRCVQEQSNFIKMFHFLGSIKRFAVDKVMAYMTKERAKSHGIGRHSTEEITDIGCRDLMALSQALGEKEYLFGSKMTTTDCYAFAHLAQILFIKCVNYPHRLYIMAKCANLVAYVERIKEQVWSDWDSLCGVIPEELIANMGAAIVDSPAEES